MQQSKITAGIAGLIICMRARALVGIAVPKNVQECSKNTAGIAELKNVQEYRKDTAVVAGLNN